MASGYKEEYCELVKECLSDGASFAAFRVKVGISKSTFYFWRKEHAEFNEACEVAAAIAQMWWEDVAKKAVTDGAPKGASPIILAGLYNRGQREEWSNKTQVEQTFVPEEKLDLSLLTDEELEALNVVASARERLKG